MSQVAWLDLAQLLNDAGFPGGTPQLNGCAIVQAESGRNPDAVHVNVDGSRDRGLWQINDRWHPEVTDAMAFDPAQATKEAFRISSGGSNYGAWATFTGGAYKSHLEASAVALDGAKRVRVLKASNAVLKDQLAAAQASLAVVQGSLQAALDKAAALASANDALQVKIVAALTALS